LERLRRRKVVQWAWPTPRAPGAFLQGLELRQRHLRLAGPAAAARDARSRDRPTRRPGPRLVPRRPVATTRQPCRNGHHHAAVPLGWGNLLALRSSERGNTGDEDPRRCAQRPKSRRSTPALDRSAAVRQRSAKADDAFFVDGIHDDILTQLSKVSALKVISRTSVERFRDTKLPLQDVAKQLGVKSILEGGVQRGGDRVRSPCS